MKNATNALLLILALTGEVAMPNQNQGQASASITTSQTI